MSEPSYRINTEREWSTSGYPWQARITRLSDGEFVQQIGAESEAAVLAMSQAWIARQVGDFDLAEGGIYFADESGALSGAVTEGQTA